MGCFRGGSLRCRGEAVIITTPPEGEDQGESVHSVPCAVGIPVPLAPGWRLGALTEGWAGCQHCLRKTMEFPSDGFYFLKAAGGKASNYERGRGRGCCTFEQEEQWMVFMEGEPSNGVQRIPRRAESPGAFVVMALERKQECVSFLATLAVGSRPAIAWVWPGFESWLCFSQAIRYFGKNYVTFLNISFFIWMEIMETGNNFSDYYFHPELVLRNWLFIYLWMNANLSAPRRYWGEP